MVNEVTIKIFYRLIIFVIPPIARITVNSENKYTFQNPY